MGKTIGSGLGMATGFMGASKQDEAASDANDAMQNAIKEAGRYATDAYNKSQHLYDPYVSGGAWATRQLRDLIEQLQGGNNYNFQQFKEAPEYQGMIDESEKALRRGAAARGVSYSGGTLKALDKNRIIETGRQYDDWVNRQRAGINQQGNLLTNLINPGLTASGNLANLHTGYGTTMGNLALGSGESEAVKEATQGALWSNYMQNLGFTGGSMAGGKQGAGDIKTLLKNNKIGS